ncbi:hypothetical protein LY78DRAFT_731607 [Colletotrichum sublineola]|nr:hypothetical protein LY78DRAFT_731607 [Colletotrichum sublineola]
MHALHCVNKVRMALDPDYYTFTESPETRRAHIDHCIDYLRQSAECHGDVTPITFKWQESVGRVVVAWKTTHTCRNFDRIHDWALDHYRA